MNPCDENYLNECGRLAEPSFHRFTVDNSTHRFSVARSRYFLGVTMSALQRLKSVIPGVDDEDPNTVRTFECQECGNEFESAKSPKRAQCMECLSHDVEPQ